MTIKHSHQAPKEYTPEYCNSVVIALKEAIEHVKEASQKATEGQGNYIQQSLDHVSESLEEGDRQFAIMRAEIDTLKKQIADVELELDDETTNRRLNDNSGRNHTYKTIGGATLLVLGALWAIIEWVTRLVK